MHQLMCEFCHNIFESARSDAKTCCNAHRVALFKQKAKAKSRHTTSVTGNTSVIVKKQVTHKEVTPEPIIRRTISRKTTQDILQEFIDRVKETGMKGFNFREGKMNTIPFERFLLFLLEQNYLKL